METRNLKEGPAIKQYLSSISISQGNSNEVTNIIFTSLYLCIAIYACAELFCVLTYVSNKFVFRRFPL